MEMLKNPEFMKMMMQNPAIKSMYSDPKKFKQMMENNPMIQNLIKKHPEMEGIFDDEEAMKMFQDMQDPAKFEEIMRQQDQMLANLQNMPGGQQLLNEIQTDINDAVDESLTGQRRNENTEWFLPSTQPKPQEKKTEAQVEANDEKLYPLPRSYVEFIGITKKQAQTQQAPAFAPPPQPQFGMPGGNMFGQGYPDMNTVQEIIQNPMIQQFMDQIIDDPAQFAAYINNPMVRVQLEQMGGSNPILRQMLDNPESFRQQLQMARGLMKNGGFGSFGAPANPQPQPNQQQRAESGEEQLAKYR